MKHEAIFQGITLEVLENGKKLLDYWMSSIVSLLKAFCWGGLKTEIMQKQDNTRLLDTHSFYRSSIKATLIDIWMMF